MKGAKMIKIFNPISNEQKVFENYHQSCNYLTEIEKKKAPLTGELRWMFIRRRHETLSTLYYRSSSLLKNFFTPKEKEAIEKELGLIEILKGDKEKLTQILCTPHLDTEPLKRDWCHGYCEEHGFELTEWLPKG